MHWWRIRYRNLVVLKNTTELLDPLKQLLQGMRKSLIDTTLAVPVKYNEKMKKRTVFLERNCAKHLLIEYFLHGTTSYPGIVRGEWGSFHRL